MKKTSELMLGAVALLVFELLMDGSGVGMKERWEKMKAWAKH